MTVDEEIAAFIQKRGVTRCPAAAALGAEPGAISAEDRAAIAARGADPVGDDWRKTKVKKSPGWGRYWTSPAGLARRKKS